MLHLQNVESQQWFIIFKVSESRKAKKQEEEERKKLSCQVEMLRREVEQALQERDKAMRESHDLR